MQTVVSPSITGRAVDTHPSRVRGIAAALALAGALALVAFVCALACAAPQALAATGSESLQAEQDAHVQALKSQASEKDAAKTATPAKPTKKQLAAFKKSSADFSLELFRQCVKAKGKNANVTVAPMSVLNALAVTANGAAGETRAQMREVLGGKATIKRLNANLSWYNAKLCKSKNAHVSVANSIWYHNDGTIRMRKGFLNVAKKRYAAQVAARDFADPATVDAINGWVADNTGGMIRRVISELYPEDRLAIVNALYFDAKWRSPYTKDDVRKRKFTMANGKKRTVNMMFSTEHRYIEGKNARGFVKPYVKGYSYVALLPKKGMGLKKFVSTLDGDAFRALVGSATDAVVHAALPKYSLTYSNDDMADQLKAMGMRTAFSSDADFSKMALDTQGSLMIGDVVHKTKVDVDEEGTRAAAVTAIVMKTSAAPFGNAKTVVLNRPFVYAIVDNATNLPVFIGTVNAPTKA